MTDARITPFLFEGEHTIREVDVNGLPKFVAKDVASALGYKNPRHAIITHCKHGQPIGESQNATPHHLDPQTVIIPESDVYRLILKSKLPAAERFEEWLMGEVLPAIRNTGSYTSPEAANDISESIQMQDSLKLRKVNLCHRLFGERAGQQMWRKVDLEWVPAMASVLSQHDMFDSAIPPGSVTITVTPDRKAA